MYAVYDAKAELFGNPFMDRTDGSARRAFQVAINSPESNVAMAPEDYSLFRLGTYDEETGMLTPEVAPVRVCLGLELVKVDQVDGPALEVVNDG